MLGVGREERGDTRFVSDGCGHTRVLLDTSELERVLKNTAQYCEGFIAGGEAGLPLLLAEIGEAVKEAMGLWMDAMASGNHAALHHVYEWYQTGSAGA